MSFGRAGTGLYPLRKGDVLFFGGKGERAGQMEY